MGETLRTLSQLMALEALGPGKYMSKSPSWAPGGRGAAYGGHVYAQSAWAASQTVNEGMVIHNVHGYFTLPGKVDRPYVFTVETISEGRSYCTRSVSVRQPLSPSPSHKHQVDRTTRPFEISDASQDLGDICFHSICSFKRDEPRDWGHQEVKDLRAEYASVLQGKWPKDHAYAPVVDAPWYISYANEYPQPNEFPGLDMRKVVMDPWNDGKKVEEYRQLTLYRLLGNIPASNPNLHAVAHLFASDRNSLFHISNAMGYPDHVEKMASLSHSVVFHVDSKRLLLPETSGDAGDAGWFCQEAWTPRSEGGRGIHESKIWNFEGLHIASSWQDGLVRRSDSDTPKQKSGYMVVSRHKL